jgi:hypothetical protein
LKAKSFKVAPQSPNTLFYLSLLIILKSSLNGKPLLGSRELSIPRLKTIFNNSEMVYFFLDLLPDEDLDVLRLDEERLLETEREEERELREE